jgi:hypothetical protein
MKQLLILLLIVFPFIGFGQKDTVFYYGVNGKMDNLRKKDIMKEVDYQGSKKIKVKTYKITDTGWQLIYTENIKIESDSVFQIRMKGDEFSGRVTRKFEKLEDGTYKFTDWLDENIKRQGQTKSKVPLLLDGEVTDFYPRGRIKSISQFKNNELYFNQNWYPNGDVMIDDVFYSVDEEPQFEPGKGVLQEHVMKAIKDAKFDLLTVEGRVVVGIVVTRDGEIDGVQIVKGISQVLNGILVSAFNSLEGRWIPAKLNGKDVNYFLRIPINFIFNKYDFEYLELKGSNLYWEIN